MALKRRHKIDATFSMASMTDVIFLLLIFFMITSTIGNEAAQPVTYDQLVQKLAETPQHDTERFVALYADETVPYREIVKILNIANDNRLKMVLAAKPVHNP